jgi:hypothetical protein
MAIQGMSRSTASTTCTIRMGPFTRLMVIKYEILLQRHMNLCSVIWSTMLHQTGQSSINLFADSILLTGFQFVGGSTKGDILKVSGSYNRLENLNFSNYESPSSLESLEGVVTVPSGPGMGLEIDPGYISKHSRNLNIQKFNSTKYIYK